MTTYHKIVPAFDDSLKVGFEIPQKTGDPIRFEVPRMDYLPRKVGEAYAAWIDEFYKDKEMLPVEALQIDWFMDNIGLPKTIANKVKALTNGEKQQIFSVWNGESSISVGESEASAHSSETSS